MPNGQFTDVGLLLAASDRQRAAQSLGVFVGYIGTRSDQPIIRKTPSLGRFACCNARLSSILCRRISVDGVYEFRFHECNVSLPRLMNVGSD